MDTLGSRIEQSLKEMQLARAAFDTVCDKSVLDITDTSTSVFLISLYMYVYLCGNFSGIKSRRAKIP